MCSSIITAERIVAVGFAMERPAMSAAEPCRGGQDLAGRVDDLEADAFAFGRDDRRHDPIRYTRRTFSQSIFV